MEIDYPAVFEPFFKTPKRYNVGEGGRGRGASWTIARKLITEAAGSKQRVLCTREYQSSIRDSVHRVLVDQIDALKLNQCFVVQRDSITSVAGSEFIFKGLHNNVQEVKSIEGVTRVWVEEAEKVSTNSWEILIPTIRTEGSQFYISYNPDDENGATYQRFHLKPPPDSNVIFSTYADNPWFPKVLRQEMEYCKSVDYEAYEHIWLGKCKTYAEALILRGKFTVEAFETPSDGVQFMFGADFGFSSDPSCLVRMFIRDNTLYIDHEAYGHGVEIDELEKFFEAVPGSRKWRIKADSARPDTISYLRRRGFNIVGAEKGKGSVEDGIQFLRGFKQIIIHPRCTGTKGDFENYKWKRDKITGLILPVPAEGFDHAPDACLKGDTMILTEQGDKAIKDVKIGDKVMTRVGFKPVLWSGISRKNAEMLKIETESGKVVFCTPDHKIFTSAGFIRADAVRYGHELLTVSEEPCKSAKRSFLEVTPTGDTHSQTSGLKKCTSGEAEDLAFTEQYGKQKTDQRLKGTKSITRTGMPSTTISRTLSASKQESTTDGMGQPRKAKRHQGEASTKCDTLPRSGTEAKRGASGTANTLSKLQRQDPYINGNANSAIKLTPSGRGLDLGFARMDVNQNGVGGTESTTLSPTAPYAEKSSSSTNSRRSRLVADRVLTVSVLAEKEAEVFDLTVKDKPEFFANGILVHNCRYALEDYTKQKVSIFQALG